MEGLRALCDANNIALIFDEVQLRQSPPCPIDGKPQRRATLAEVERLLEDPEPPRAALG